MGAFLAPGAVHVQARYCVDTGCFIVLEGMDGAGTTTHARLLTDALRARRLPVHATAEPSGGPIGALVRQALKGRVVAGGALGRAEPLSWGTMALLFAADRLDHLEAEVLPNLADGTSVISDRYYHSTVAYQSLAGGGASAIPWLRELNAKARVPDLTIVLDTPADVAAERRNARGGPVEIYDGAELQARLGDFYRELERYFPGEPIVHIDSGGPMTEVAERVQAAVFSTLSLGGS